MERKQSHGVCMVCEVTANTHLKTCAYGEYRQTTDLYNL